MPTGGNAEGSFPDVRVHRFHDFYGFREVVKIAEIRGRGRGQYNVAGRGRGQYNAAGRGRGQYNMAGRGERFLYVTCNVRDAD